MILGRHIYSLLKRHTAVYVSGLGTFRRVRTSASFDAKRNVVLPPLSYIEFEHDVNEGFDFALYVQQSQQLDKTQAESYVQHEVARLVNTVNKEGQVTLDELGQLVSYGNSYIFKPFDLSGFQFVPIEDPYISGNEIDESYENNAASQKAIQDASNDSAQNANHLAGTDNHQQNLSNIQNTEQSQEDLAQGQVYFDEEPKRNNSLIYALIAVLALVIVGSIYYYSIISKKLDNVDKYISEIDSVDHNDDSLLNAIDTNLISFTDSGEMLVDSVAKKDSIAPAPKVVAPVLNKYTIVIGTHPKIEQAEAEAAEYRRKGYEHVRAIEPAGGKKRKRVIWDTYPTVEQRDSALRYVSKLLKNNPWPSEIN